MQLRMLTAEGVKAFSDYLQALREGRQNEKRPSSDLNNLSKPIDMQCPARVDPEKVFLTRYEIGQYLNEEVFAHCSAKDREYLEGQPSLWAWLALLWFDQLCPTNQEGELRPRADALYIPEEARETTSQRRNSETWGRHLIRTSYLLVSKYGEKVDFLLSSPPNKHSDLIEQLMGRADLLACQPVIEALRLLYRDPDTGKSKKGAASKGGGAVRRFAKLINQLSLNYDLYSLDSIKLIELLPDKEFQHFHPAREP